MKKEEELGLECSVCFEIKPVDSVTFLPCIHFLCSCCYEKLKKNECPFCRNKLREEHEEDSYDETENEYNDVQFEILVLEESRTRRRNRKNRRQEKKIMKLMRDTKEILVSIDSVNTYTILGTLDS